MEFTVPASGWGRHFF